MRLAYQAIGSLCVLAAVYVVATHRPTYFFVYSFDPILSSIAQQSITTWMQEKQSIISDPALLVQKIHEQYPWIAHCSLSYFPNHRITILVAAHRPVIKIEDNLVVINTDIIAAQDIFEAAYIEQLPTIAIHKKLLNNRHALQQLTEWFSLIGSALYERYAIEVTASYQLLLHERNNRLTLMFSLFDAAISDEMLWYEKVTNLGVQKLKHLKSKKRMIADVRFKNYIIFYGDKGEYHEQTHI